jgi:3,4-dihydroxy-2-butanone 4-phosphate synthase
MNPRNGGGVIVIGSDNRENEGDLIFSCGDPRLKLCGVLYEVMSPDGTMARLEQPSEFAGKNNFPLLSAGDIMNYRPEVQDY